MTKSVVTTKKQGRKKVNQYILMKVLGEGKFARVYLAFNEQNGKDYAMK
jgi:serine/threonine protein kinase